VQKQLFEEMGEFADCKKATIKKAVLKRQNLNWLNCTAAENLCSFNLGKR